MQPLVSIALCTYNSGNFLVPMLESLLAQTWTNIEIVCCDDKSSDSTIETLEKYRNKYPSVFKIVLNENNLGYIKNFEKCLSLCNGDFIAIADHDDIWLPQKIEALVNAIDDAMMVYSDSILIDEKGNDTGKKISHIFRLHDQPPAHAFIFYDFVWGHTALLRKELLQYALPVPEKMPYDTWLAYTAASISHINYAEEALTCWRQHDKSFTSVEYNKNKSQRESKNRKYEEHKAKLHRIKLLGENKNTVDKNFMKKLYSNYESLLRGNSIKLFLFLTRHQKTLFPIWRRGYLSKLNEFRKMARGVKNISQ